MVGAQTIPIPALSFVAGPSQAAGTVPLSADVMGLSIAPDATFELRIHFNAGSTTGTLPSDVFVNEFHYDNTGTDTGEFVEIAVGPGFTGALSDISVVFYNGGTASAAAPYGTFNLANDFSSGDTVNGFSLFFKNMPANGIQNGSNDGFAIVNTATSQVLHFISYKGVMVAASGPASGMTSIDIGVTQTGNDPVGLAALGLFGSGGSASDFIWKKFNGIAHSPGHPNDSQTFTVPALQPRGLAIDNLSVTLLSDHDQDGLADGVDPDDDNDGQSDDYETAFGSNLRDATSRFLPVLARSVTPPHGLELSFPGATGISYTVESSGNLTNWQDLITITGSGSPIVVPLPSSGSQMFFRVRAGE